MTEPVRPDADGAERDAALDARIEATKELVAALGLTAPTLRQMRAAVAAIRSAEERGAAREREANAAIADECMSRGASWRKAAAYIANAIRLRARSEGKG